MNPSEIADRTFEGIVEKDYLFRYLSAPLPELCKPTSNSRIEGFCDAMMVKVGKVALLIENDHITVDEGIDIIVQDSGCKDCPIKKRPTLRLIVNT